MADSKKKEDFGTRAFNALTMLAAPFVARKAITVVWTKVTGKKPPTNPEDPGVAFVEALAWSVLTGVTVAALQAARDPGCSAQGAKRRGPRVS